MELFFDPDMFRDAATLSAGIESSTSQAPCIFCQKILFSAILLLILPLAIFDRDVRPPNTLEALASCVRVVEKNVCISELGGAVPLDPRLEETF